MKRENSGEKREGGHQNSSVSPHGVQLKKPGNKIDGNTTSAGTSQAKSEENQTPQSLR